MSVWECERYDWSRLDAAQGTSASIVPEALEALRTATSEDAAREAYWRLDNTVVVQGRLFEAALPTAACIITILGSSTSEVARVRLVELLEQISGGETQPDRTGLLISIRREIRRGFGIFVGLLQYGVELERELCVDLLISCALGESELLDRVRFYLRKLSLDPGASERVRGYASARLSDMQRR
jgi:hypothetical protein